MKIPTGHLNLFIYSADGGIADEIHKITYKNKFVLNLNDS